MASIVYNRCKAQWLAGAYNFDTAGDTLVVRLHTSGYVPDPDHTTTTQLTDEVVGTGYTSGGKTLLNQAVTQDDTENRAYLSASNVSWDTATITARYAVIVNTTVGNELVCCVDFGEDKSSTGLTFMIDWNADGIIRLA